MAAAITDKFKKVKGFFSTTLASQKTSGAASMSLSDATGVPTTTGLVFTVGRVDSSGTATPSERAIYKGTLSGTTVSNLTLTEGTDQTHAAGTVVEITWTETHWNDAVDGILEEHKQDGTHSDITADSLTFADATGIKDENGNEQITFQTTASAVNEIEVTNAATGNAPQIAATGGDTNIDLKLIGKGTGKVYPGLQTGFQTASVGSVSSTTYVDVSGVTETFTPSVACYAIVTFGGDLRLDATGSLILGLNVDGSVDSSHEIIRLKNTGAEANSTTCSKQVRVALSAASHTLKLQIKRATTTSNSANNLFMSILLVSQ